MLESYTPIDLNFSDFTVTDQAVNKCIQSISSPTTIQEDDVFKLLNDMVSTETDTFKSNCITPSASLKESYDLAKHGTEFLVELPPLEEYDTNEYFECSELDDDIKIEPFYAPTTKKILKRNSSSKIQISLTLYERRRQKIVSKSKTKGINKIYKM
ncbi:hypothetical protein AKO1_013111 [Acrasis kona]|uniref:Uncharacterized protein n=1 Tax=Acrasis kona TaxID=1008807 RepID=A0AAW2ZJJ1_9EUKA